MIVFTLCCTVTALYLFEHREVKHILLKYLTESQENIVLLQKKHFQRNIENIVDFIKY